MRKAFDANVPKLKPRLKASAPAAAAAQALPPGETGGDEGATGTSPSTPTAPPSASVRPEPFDSGPLAALRSGQAESKGAGNPEPNDVLSRKDRLEKIKRRVAEAARPAPRPAPVPTDPARAAESVLGLVRDLEAELLRAREREEALAGDLDEAKKELSRVVAEGRGAAERLSASENELEEKRSVLAELLEEMKTLEDERDESVRRAQALSALDEERARLLDEVTRRADEEARLRAEREVEVERLSEELRAGAQDGARLRAAIGELARERDQLGQDLERTRKERDELAAAKRALEQVHAALAHARARLG